MIRNWLKKYLPKHDEIKQNKSLSWLGTTLHHPNLWHLNRRSVSRGVAVGVFAAFIPLPIQMLIAALLALLVRANLPIAVVGTWITNPITFIPINFLIYKVGELILGEKNGFEKIEVSVTWDGTFLGLVDASMMWVNSLGKTFLVGVPIVAFTAALLSFVLVQIIWRIAVKTQWRKRKTGRE